VNVHTRNDFAEFCVVALPALFFYPWAGGTDEKIAGLDDIRS
jgi:hypothetical protein